MSHGRSSTGNERVPSQPNQIVTDGDFAAREAAKGMWVVYEG